MELDLIKKQIYNNDTIIWNIGNKNMRIVMLKLSEFILKYEDVMNIKIDVKKRYGIYVASAYVSLKDTLNSCKRLEIINDFIDTDHRLSKYFTNKVLYTNSRVESFIKKGIESLLISSFTTGEVAKTLMLEQVL